jgi:hypothetical protein
VAILVASVIAVTSSAGEPEVKGVADPASPSPAVHLAPDARPTAPSTATSGEPIVPFVVHPDPWGLPRLPGSQVTSVDEGSDGAVQWTLMGYVAERATQDQAREHYRRILRDGGWFVGDVDFRNGIWTFAANHGDREAQIEISADDDGVQVSAFVSDTIAPPSSPVPSATATPAAPPDTPRPPRGDRSRVEPPRTDRPGTVRRPPRTRPRPPRPRDDRRPGQRAGGDRDDDDDDDDDDD